MFSNPWKDILKVKGDHLTLQEIIRALQWGAPSGRLTPDIKKALTEKLQATR